jgi:hypothetical protein
MPKPPKNPVERSLVGVSAQITAQKEEFCQLERIPPKVGVDREKTRFRRDKL